MKSFFKTPALFMTLSLLLALPMASQASSRTILSCSSFGSFESFELTPPVVVGGHLSLRIDDMSGMEPMTLILTGKVSEDKFDVKGRRPSFRLGQIEIGRLVGQKQSDDVWKMIWYPIGTSLNGSKRLMFDCERH